MTDNADKNQDATLAEIEAEQPSPQTQAPSSFADKPEHRSSGGGFVWLLATLLVIGGGGYAVWPFVAPSVEPTLKTARALLGFQARPTQPSLPSAPPMDQPQASAPMAPPSVQPSTQNVEPAPVFAPESMPEPMPEPGFESAPQAAEPNFEPQPTPQPQPNLNAAPVHESPVMMQPTPVIEPSAEVAPMVQSLTDRLDILEAQLLSVTAANGSDTARAAGDATAHLTRTLSELKADMATLKTRMAALESAPRGQIDPSASAQALVLSVTQLGTQVESDRPFEMALSAVERIGGAEPVIAAAVARLRTYAGSGAPTHATITAGFKAMAVAVMKAHGQTARTGWWDEVVGTAANLVTVRQTDPARIEDPVERALAVAELALRNDDLKTALAAMDSLQGVEASAAGAWREAARARVDVRDAMSVLHNHALAALAATGGS